MAYSTLLGLTGALYISTNGRTSWGTLNTTTGIYVGMPANSLSLVQVVKNVNLTNDAGTADFSNRYSNYKMGGAALYDAAVELEIPWSPADSGLIAFINAYVSRTPMQLAILDQAIATSGTAQGLWADWAVMSLPIDQPIDKEQSTKIKLMPTVGPSTLAGIGPQWVQI